jgi:hypothetical protein
VAVKENVFPVDYGRATEVYADFWLFVDGGELVCSTGSDLPMIRG